MTLEALLFQALNGLAAASSLFFVGAGLSLIFGVTRIINIAHGSFYMLGLYLAATFATKVGGALGFWGGIAAAGLMVAALGALIEMLLLRRIYQAPELFQLLATFALRRSTCGDPKTCSGRALRACAARSKFSGATFRATTFS